MKQSLPREWLALAALFAGATAIATAPLFVKVSETGPVATAFIGQVDPKSLLA